MSARHPPRRFNSRPPSPRQLHDPLLHLSPPQQQSTQHSTQQHSSQHRHLVLTPHHAAHNGRPQMSVAVNGAPPPPPLHSPRSAQTPSSGATAVPAQPTTNGALMTPSQKLSYANEATWLLIGSVAEQMNDLERAQAAYEHALRHNPHSSNCLMQLAGIARIKENYPQAVEYFQRVINVSPDNGDAWSAIGHCYLMQDDLQKAYAAYQQALYWLPNPKEDPKLWYGIGILYDRYGSLDHAEEAFASVLRMDRDFDKANEILFRLGIIYKQQGKYPQSLDCFERILRSPPNPLAHVDIWFQMGHVYEQQKDYHRAKDAYERVVQDKPHHAKVLQQLGWLHHQPDAPFQNQELAIQYLTKSLEADPADAQSWYLLGRAYMQGQKYNKAYEAYQQAVYRDGRNPTFWCSIGVLYFQINQYRDALDAYSRAIRINPYISEVWFDLGSLYESCNNQISDAIDAYARASELDPANAVISHRLALLRNAQETGGSVPAAPGPQDVHPTAYAGSHAGPPALHTSAAAAAAAAGGAPPLLFAGPTGRSIFTGADNAPRMTGPGVTGGSPGPFRGGPPPPVVLDDARAGRMALHTPLAPMEVDRPRSVRGNGMTMGPGGVLLHHPQPARYDSPDSSVRSGEGYGARGGAPQTSPTGRFEYAREGSPRSEKEGVAWERERERERERGVERREREHARRDVSRERTLREASRERPVRQAQQQQYAHPSRGGSPVAPYPPYDTRRGGSPAPPPPPPPPPRTATATRTRSNSDDRARAMQPPPQERWTHWGGEQRERDRERERPAFRSPTARYDPRFDGREEERKYAPSPEDGFRGAAPAPAPAPPPPPPPARGSSSSSSMLGLSTLPPPPQPNISSSMHARPRASESPAPEREKDAGAGAKGAEQKRRGAKVKEEDGTSSGVEKKGRKKRAPGKRAAAAAAARGEQWASNGGSASTSAGRSPETMSNASRRSPLPSLPPLRPVDEDYDEGVDALMAMSASRPPPPLPSSTAPPPQQQQPLTTLPPIMSAPPVQTRPLSTSPTAARPASRASNSSRRSERSHSISMPAPDHHTPSLKRPHSGSDHSETGKRARLEDKASPSVHGSSPVEPRGFAGGAGLQGPGEAPLRLPPISTLSPKASISPTSTASPAGGSGSEAARRGSPRPLPQEDEDDRMQLDSASPPPVQAIRVAAEKAESTGADSPQT